VDLFYLAYVAVAAGFFWISLREDRGKLVLVQWGWIFLGLSLGSAVALMVPAPEAIGVYQALRSMALGGAVICLGFSFIPSDSARKLPNAEIAKHAEALEAISPNPPLDTV
jgi:hypothetical protein